LPDSDIVGAQWPNMTGPGAVQKKEEALSVFKEARKLWQQKSRSEIADAFAERAETKAAGQHQGGFQNSARQEAAGYSMPSRSGDYTPEFEMLSGPQQKMMERMAKPPVAERALRNAGQWMAPNSLNTSAGAVIALTQPQTLPAILGLATGGYLSKKASQGLASRRANIFDAMVKNADNLKPGEFKALQQAMAEMAARTGRFAVPQEDE
jgi:hypothetical protein